MAHYTYKFRLAPNADQQHRLAKHFGVCRFVYNHFLDRRNALYQESKEGSSYHKDCAALTKLKKELPWISEANSQSLQQELKNLDTAFGRFFRRLAKFPRFHSKHKDKQSFRIPQFVTVEDGKVCFPKFKEGIKVRLHRKIEGTIRYATVSRDTAGRYFVSICVERDIPTLKPGTKEVGVDLGISALATCSDGTKYENIRPYRTLERRLRRLQQSLSRKVKGSKSRERARRRVAKIHCRIADIRMNHIHQTTRRMVNENQVICVETLNVCGMMRNRRLAKSVQDVSLYELVRQLEYKCGWYGRSLLKIDRWYPSSKACSGCGFVKQELQLSERSWVCPRCGVEHDRDFNAATNILMEGKRTVGTTGLAGGEKRQSSARKQFSVKPEAATSQRAKASRG